MFWDQSVVEIFPCHVWHHPGQFLCLFLPVLTLLVQIVTTFSSVSLLAIWPRYYAYLSVIKKLCATLVTNKQTKQMIYNGAKRITRTAIFMQRYRKINRFSRAWASFGFACNQKRKLLYLNDFLCFVTGKIKETRSARCVKLGAFRSGRDKPDFYM